MGVKREAGRRGDGWIGGDRGEGRGKKDVKRLNMANDEGLDSQMPE